MTRVNSCQFVVDFTGNSYFNWLSRDGKKLAFSRFVGFIKSVTGSSKATGLRFLCYGPRAELAYAAIQAGTRAFVICHVQTRTATRTEGSEQKEEFFTEFVIEEIQYLKNVNEEQLALKRAELYENDTLPEEEGDFDMGFIK